MKHTPYFVKRYPVTTSEKQPIRRISEVKIRKNMPIVRFTKALGLLHITKLDPRLVNARFPRKTPPHIIGMARVRMPLKKGTRGKGEGKVEKKGDYVKLIF